MGDSHHFRPCTSLMTSQKQQPTDDVIRPHFNPLPWLVSVTRMLTLGRGQLPLPSLEWFSLLCRVVW